MDKQTFLTELRRRLSGLPEEDLSRTLNYYREMIDDRMEDGFSEKEAVAALGSMDDIVAQVISTTPLRGLVEARMQPRRPLRVWVIVLLILGAPLWFPLLISALSIVFSLYIMLWSLVITLYAVMGSLAVASLGCLVGAAVQFVALHSYQGLLYLGAALGCAGVAILLFLLSNAAAKGCVMLVKGLFTGIKRAIVRRGERQ